MKNHKRNKVQFLISLCFLMASPFILKEATVVFAASPVTIHSVDYAEEDIVINNNENTRIYFALEADAAKDNWEVINSDRNPDDTLADTTTIDISWISPSSENTLIIKGKEDSSQKRVMICEKTKKLNISISYTNIEKLAKNATISTLLNIMSTSGTGEEPIDFNDLEWKKGDGGKWKAINLLTVAQLEKYQIMGTYLYFRIKAVNDDEDTALGTFPNGTKGRRVSNEVKVKISKKSPSMVIGIDGEKFTAAIKYGREYRVTIDGVTSDWIKITDRAIRTVSLADIADDGSNGTTLKFPEMLLETRSYSTSKAAASKITEISLDEQENLGGNIIEGKAPVIVDPDDLDIYVSYNGIKNMIIAIPSATTAEPYEYCVVKKGGTFDITRVVWTAITKNTEVKILATKAVDEGTLYVRRKEIKSKEETYSSDAVAYKLASTYLPFSINYPSIPVVKKDNFTFTKGYPEPITIETKLNVGGKLPFETEIKNIKLGTKEIEFEEPLITIEEGDPTITTDDYFVMSVTLKEDSLKMLPACSSRAIIINFENGTVDKTSVKLTIQNPVPAYALTATVDPSVVSGSTITVVSTLGTSNTWVYTITDTKVENITTSDMVDALTKTTAFTTPKIDIMVALNKYLTIYEINSTDHIIKYKSILITQDKIKGL